MQKPNQTKPKPCRAPLKTSKIFFKYLSSPLKNVKCGKWGYKCGKGHWVIEQRKQRAKHPDYSSLKECCALKFNFKLWLWPQGIHNGHIKNSWWGKSILLNQNLAKLCELQKYKLARNINQRRVFICPYIVWSVLMDLFVQPSSQLYNWKDPYYSITIIYI